MYQHTLVTTDGTDTDIDHAAGLNRALKATLLHFNLGSVAERVVHGAAVPVLLIRHSP